MNLLVPKIQTGVSFYLIGIYFWSSKTISQLNFERHSINIAFEGFITFVVKLSYIWSHFYIIFCGQLLHLWLQQHISHMRNWRFAQQWKFRFTFEEDYFLEYLTRQLMWKAQRAQLLLMFPMCDLMQRINQRNIYIKIHFFPFSIGSSGIN